MRYIVLIAAFCCALTSCSPTWFKDFKSDPVQQTEMLLGTASSIQQIAITVFAQLKPLLPTDKQPVYQAKFDGANVALSTAMEAVRVAVQAAADAQQPNPDLTKVVQGVVDAIKHIKSVVDEVRGLLRTPAVSTAPNGSTPTPLFVEEPIGYPALDTLVTNLK